MGLLVFSDVILDFFIIKNLNFLVLQIMVAYIIHPGFEIFPPVAYF